VQKDKCKLPAEIGIAFTAAAAKAQPTAQHAAPFDPDQSKEDRRRSRMGDFVSFAFRPHRPFWPILGRNKHVVMALVPFANTLAAAMGRQ